MKEYSSTSIPGNNCAIDISLDTSKTQVTFHERFYIQTDEQSFKSGTWYTLIAHVEQQLQQLSRESTL